MSKVNVTYIWEKERLIELEQLRTLLHNVASLNNCNNFTANAESCIERAEKFISFDYRNRREDLITFMRNQGMTVHENSNTGG